MFYIMKHKEEYICQNILKKFTAQCLNEPQKISKQTT